MKHFLITIATADYRIAPELISSNIYTEEQIHNSDYEKYWYKLELTESTTFVDNREIKVRSCFVDSPIVTTITRIV